MTIALLFLIKFLIDIIKDKLPFIYSLCSFNVLYFSICKKLKKENVPNNRQKS